jgi:hypothetical protein
MRTLALLPEVLTAATRMVKKVLSTGRGARSVPGPYPVAVAIFRTSSMVSTYWTGTPIFAST